MLFFATQNICTGNEIEKLALASAGYAESGDGEKLRVTLETQLAFLEKHILQWVPALCGHIVKRCSATDCDYKLYEAAALITAGFIENDTLFIKELI